MNENRLSIPTLQSHRLVELASTISTEKQNQIIEALFHEYFVEGKNICTYREQYVSLILFHGTLILHWCSRFMDAFALAGEDGLIYSETAGQYRKQQAVRRYSVADRYRNDVAGYNVRSW